MGSHQRRRCRAARLEALRKAAAEGSDDGSSDDDGLDGLVLEAGGRVAGVGASGVNFGFRCFPNAGDVESAGGFLPRVVRDCRTVFSARSADGGPGDYSAGETFWIDAAKPP